MLARFLGKIGKGPTAASSTQKVAQCLPPVADPEKVPPFPWKNQRVWMYCYRVYDGDTKNITQKPNKNFLEFSQNRRNLGKTSFWKLFNLIFSFS